MAHQEPAPRPPMPDMLPGEPRAHPDQVPPAVREELAPGQPGEVAKHDAARQVQEESKGSAPPNPAGVPQDAPGDPAPPSQATTPPNPGESGPAPARNHSSWSQVTRDAIAEEDRRVLDAINRQAASPLVGNREADQPAAEPKDAKVARAEPERAPKAYRADLAHPGLAPPHRLRQDEGLGPEDLVEKTIRPGQPQEWVDVPASQGLEGLRERQDALGHAGQGINLVATHGEHVAPELVRELQAGSLPARLVRRARE